MLLEICGKKLARPLLSYSAVSKTQLFELSVFASIERCKNCEFSLILAHSDNYGVYEVHAGLKSIAESLA